ncbi:MAG: hypothetical protein MRERV_7c036 [Mycoplasmataceae bacterium RV_VA103A]|nr:MAG: hypothetical protein MRERV_7c036 [Mycoplasmataceae bacterium RV_VA103A]
MQNLKNHIQTQREKVREVKEKLSKEKHPRAKAMKEAMETKAQAMEERWKHKGQKMQEKAKHQKTSKVQQQKKVKEEAQNEEQHKEQKQTIESSPAESSSKTYPSRKIINNQVYEITNIQLDPEQVDIARQQYLGNKFEVWVPVGFGLVALINSVGYWVFRKTNC